jgi:hypothetical protein
VNTHDSDPFSTFLLLEYSARLGLLSMEKSLDVVSACVEEEHVDEPDGVRPNASLSCDGDATPRLAEFSFELFTFSDAADLLRVF